MPKDKFISIFESSKLRATSHSVGEKFVFFTNDEMPDNSITQIAIGSLKAGEIVEYHLHESMEEVFFILNGSGVFLIGEEQFIVNKNTCIRIPSGLLHSIKAESDLKFYYFGIAKN